MSLPLFDGAAARKISLHDETQFSASGIVSRAVFASPQARLVLFGFDAGQELTEHTSSSHAIIQILSGACEFSVDAKTQPLKQGDAIYLPPNQPHSVKATEKFSMLITLINPTTTK